MYNLGNQTLKNKDRQNFDMTNNHVNVTLIDTERTIRQFEKIHSLKIIKSINDHVRIFFTGTIMIPPEITDEQQVRYLSDYLNAANTKCEIVVKTLKIGQEILTAADSRETSNQPATGKDSIKNSDDRQKNQNETVFFRGIVKNVEISANNGTYDISIEGASYTYLLDIELKSRSFQKSAMTYQQLIQKVIGNKAICADEAQQTATIKRLFVQYKTSDWDFLKRMATQLNTGLIADCIDSKPKFWFCIPNNTKKDAVSLSAVEYQIFKNILEYKKVKQNSSIKQMPEQSFIQIQVAKCRQIFEIGDKVNFQNKDLFVSQAVADWIGGDLVHHYTLVSSEGLKQKPLMNTQIAGVSVEGKVLYVTKDQVKVQLDEFEIDKNEKLSETDLWPLVYASFYTAGEKSGWYCMPEINDHVKVYFPTSNEENAFVMSSIRTVKSGGHTRISKPNTKYFRTRFEKVLVMGEEEIILICYGKDNQKVELRFNDGSNGNNQGLITINSYSKIAINAGGAMKLHSGKNLKISADKLLDLNCKSSQLKLNGETKVYGNPAKIN